MSLPTLVPGADGYPVLPRGRYTVTMSDVRDNFVVARSDGAWRGQLMDDLERYIELLDRLGLALDSVWLDGSFISGKVTPGDIDCSPVIDAARSAPDPSITADLNDMWIAPRNRWKHEPVPGIGRTLNLDIYGIVKVPDAHPGHGTYAALRGHWDDWWQRSRATGETLAKGYVEVVLS
ncbi:hypothetical protein GCM10022273_28960 [Cellulomonas soli]